MLKSQIVVGGHYRALVSDKLTTVRVDVITDHTVRGGYSGASISGKQGTGYSCTNLATGRKVVFRSAAKFRSEVKIDPAGRQHVQNAAGQFRPIPPTETTHPFVAPAATAAVTDQTPSPINGGLLSRLKPSILNESPREAPHLIVRARAGTGKTTTLVEGMALMRGVALLIEPSAQQRAVWDAMLLSKDVWSVCFTCFNKGIATELGERMIQRGLDKRGCKAMTMHSLGFAAVRNAFPGVRLNNDRTQDIIAELSGADVRDLRRREGPTLACVERLVGLCKMNLTQPEGEPDEVNEDEEEALLNGWAVALDRLIAHQSIDIDGVDRDRVHDLVPRVLERARDVLKDRCIGFDDMPWLPVVLDLPVVRHDVLLVDEAQDLNRCTQALAKKAGKRLILCGDDRQAIYGFAGADAESMERMASELGADARGCVELPLTVTRRCGKAIVAEANQIVADFEAHPNNGPGAVSQAAYPTRDGKERPKPWYTDLVDDGDMVLCRCNAPLVSQCFRFIKAGRKATIQGRDVGAGLRSTIERAKAQSVPNLVAKVTDWAHDEIEKENAKRHPSEARLIGVQDRADCIVAFTEGCRTVAEVLAKIEAVFTDDRTVRGIKLSSIHKAKGLEADRVFFLRPKEAPCPHPMAATAWAQEQEQNLVYVAITRARKELVYVS